MPDAGAEPDPTCTTRPEAVSWKSTVTCRNPDREGKAGSGYELKVLFDADEQPIPDELTSTFIEHCCRSALDAQGQVRLDTVAEVELSVQCLDPEAMRQLNLQYRQKDKPTNVLSFAAEMPPMPLVDAGIDSGAADDCTGNERAFDGSSVQGLLILGDLVLCPQVVEQESLEQHKPLLHHWAHMLVHGTLHLCGHDHEEASGAQSMESLEIRILSGLGFPDPYSVIGE